jgi:hypothetical protein
MFKFVQDFIGYPTIGQVAVELPYSGVVVSAQDPVFGGAEFMLVQANGVIPVNALVQILPTFNATTLRYDYFAVVAANTATTGRMFGVAMQAMTAAQFGWIMVTGTYPVSGTATVAAGTSVGITAAGQVGALVVGKGVFSMISINPATATVVKASVTGKSGDNKIYVANTNGLFIGGYLSGTGVGASTIITAIDEIKNELTVSVVNSATVTGNVTQTNNNATIFYNTVNFNRPSAALPLV